MNKDKFSKPVEDAHIVDASTGASPIASDLATGKEPTVIVVSERRRRYTAAQKLALVRETMEAGKSVSMVARERKISPSMLFRWRNEFQAGKLTPDLPQGAPSPKDYADAMAQIRRLQRLLGEAHEEISILQQAHDYAKAKKWIAR